MLGSADSAASAPAYAQADVAIAAKPLPSRHCRWVGLDTPPVHCALPRRAAANPTSSLRAPAAAGAGVTVRAPPAPPPGAGPAVGWGVAGLLDTACCVAVLPASNDLEQLTGWLLQVRELLRPSPPPRLPLRDSTPPLPHPCTPPMMLQPFPLPTPSTLSLHPV